MPPENLLPFGPFHIVIQHLPIGLIIGVWVLECFVPKPEKKCNAPLAWMHTVLLLATALTIALGLIYQTQGGYGEEINAHRQWGLVFGAGLLATYLLFWLNTAVRHGFTHFLYILTLTLTTAALFVSGHLGGELIHGKGFLLKPFKQDADTTAAAPVKTNTTHSNQTKPAPKTAKPPKTQTPQVMAKPQASPESTVVAHQNPHFADSQPPNRVALFHAAHTVFERNCITCHGSTKKKGGYRLDTKETLFTAGKSKIQPVLAGNPEESHIILRMKLPREHDEAMPPIEKDPVSATDLEAVRAWILAGAYWPTDAEIRATADTFKEYGNPSTDKHLAAISATGVKAEYNAWGDDSVRIDLAVVHPGQLEKAIEALRQFGPELVWIDSSNLDLPDEFFNALNRFEQLQRLHLDGTNVTDAQLKQIAKLEKLQYLNLYNTAITDQAIPALGTLPSLQKIYLGATQVTEPAIKQLRQANPALQIVHRSPALISNRSAGTRQSRQR